MANYKVGEAPWEVGPRAEAKPQIPTPPPAQAVAPKSFPVGQAPWETGGAQATAPAPAVPSESQDPIEKLRLKNQQDVENLKNQIKEDPLGVGLLGKFLDYPSGIARSGLAEMLGIQRPGEGVSAIQGEAVPGGEILKRLDVPEGPRVNLMPEIPIPFTQKRLGVGDTSARDIGGFAIDQGLNPLTYMSGGLATPAASTAERSGAKLFKSGLKKVDETLIEKGQKPVSDVLLEHGIAGTNKQISKKAANLAQDLNKERAGLLEVGDAAGARVDMKAATDGAVELAKRLQRDPGMSELGDSLLEKINKYRTTEAPTPTQASEWKTNLYNALPANAYDKFGKPIAPVKGIERAMASGVKNETERALNSVTQAGGEELAAVNQDLGSLLAARKPIAREVRKANTKNMFTSVDAGIAGYGLHDPLTAAGLLTAKKAGDLSKTTLFRTQAGLGLNRLGKGRFTGPAMDALTREMLPSPWMTMETKRKNGR